MSWLDTLIYGYRTVLAAGVARPERTKLDFTSGFIVVDNPTLGTTSVTVAAGAGGGYQIVDANGTPVTQRPILNFSGDFTAVDNAGATRTDVGLVAYTTIAANGSDVAKQRKVNYSADFTVADNGGASRTDVGLVAYTTVAGNGSAATKRPTINFSSDFTVADNGGASRTDVGVSAYTTVAVGGAAATKRRTENFSTDFSVTDNSGAARTDIALVAPATGAPLDNMIITLPGVSSIDSTQQTCPFNAIYEAQMDGHPNTLYNVTLRVRAVVEFRAYAFGSRTGRIYTAGARDPTNPGGMSALRNVYRLEIDDPNQYYWLNAWDGVEAVATKTVTIDQSFTAQVRGQCWVRLLAFSDYEWVSDVPSGAYTAGQAKNQDGTGANPRTVGGGGILVTEPYDGQFIQINVTAVS